MTPHRQRHVSDGASPRTGTMSAEDAIKDAESYSISKNTRLRSPSQPTLPAMSLLNSTTGKPTKRQNLVLPTMFVSTKNLTSGQSPPISPLQNRRPRNSVSKAKMALKKEIALKQQELNQLREKKETIEKLKYAADAEIYTGTYSTMHLQKHSQRIKANSQIRELEKTMVKLENQLGDLKSKLEQTKLYQDNQFLLGKDGHDVSRAQSLDDADSNMNKSAIYSQSNQDQQNSTDTLLTDLDNLERKSTLADSQNRSLHESNNVDSIHGGEINNISESNNKSTRNQYDIEDDDALVQPDVDNSETLTWLISDIMQTLQDSKLTSEKIAQKSNEFINILKNNPSLRSELALTSFMKTLQKFLLSEETTTVAAAFRMCRYLIDGRAFIQYLLQLRLDAFIIISLAKENPKNTEREQALKLFREFMNYKSGITLGLTQAIISCIERTDDNLRNMALETLLELCFIKPEVVKKCRGMRVLELLLHDYSSFSLTSIILNTIFVLMSCSQTREHFIDDFDISILITVFSDTNSRSILNTEKMQCASILIARALRNYNGTMLFAINNFRPLKELLSFFQLPLCAQYLLDIFLDVLRIKPISFRTRAKFSINKKIVPSKFTEDCIMVNQQTGLLVKVLEHVKFTDNLFSLIDVLERNTEKNESMLVKARYLLSEYLNLRTNLVNSRYSNNITSLIKDQFSVYEETYQLKNVTSELNKHRNTIHMGNIDYMHNIQKIAKSDKEHLLVHELDDFSFRKMVFDSKVLQTKEFELWNWNIIQELLEGPLMNKKQLEELAKSTKFIRRLLIFYRPLRMRFSTVNKGTKLSEKYITTGCQFFRMLTSTPEGLKILGDDTKIIPQLASLMFRAMEGHTSGNIFNESSLEKKIVSGYFKFIGVLTQTVEGIKELNRWNFFTIIYKMFELDSEIGYNFLLLTLPELEMRHSYHCQIIIKKALVVNNEKVRVATTRYVGIKLKELVELKVNNFKTTDERIRMQQLYMEMLTRQLYDLSPEVVAVADQALYECILKGTSFQELSGTFTLFLDQMVFIRSPILYEIMGRPYGFQLLNSIDFVKDERTAWLTIKNREYVLLIEEFLSTDQEASGTSPFFHRDNQLPLHFYESLAKTEDGVSLINQNGDLVKFMNSIRGYVVEGMRNEDPEYVLELKSALWCCGFIGSTDLGIGLLDNFSIVEDIIQISFHSSVTSLRSTAFYVLGLISKTFEGCEILDELGWICCIDVRGRPVGITLPIKLDKFLSFIEKPWTTEENVPKLLIEYDTNRRSLVNPVDKISFDMDFLSMDDGQENKLPTNELMTPEGYGLFSYSSVPKSNPEIDSENSKSARKKSFRNSISSPAHDSSTSNEVDNVLDKVLKMVSQLGNHILSNNAVRGLTELNLLYGPQLFQNQSVFIEVMNMMSLYRFKPPVRKFLCGLILTNISLENVIRTDRKTGTQPIL